MTRTLEFFAECGITADSSISVANVWLALAGLAGDASVSIAD